MVLSVEHLVAKRHTIDIDIKQYLSRSQENNAKMFMIIDRIFPGTKFSDPVKIGYQLYIFYVISSFQ